MRPAVGCLLRHTMLASTAIYEVIAVDGELVTVEVRQAPGLAGGTRVRLLASAVLEMEQLEAPVLAGHRAVGAAGPVGAER